MLPTREQFVRDVCRRFDCDAGRLIDILWCVQDRYRCIDAGSVIIIAEMTGLARVQVDGVISFYAFFTSTPIGVFAIYLCDDIVDRHADNCAVQKAFEEACGISLDGVSNDGLFSLHLTPCIGLSDQAPAALVQGRVLTHLTPERVVQLVSRIKEGGGLDDELLGVGDGNNRHPLIGAPVRSNIRKSGSVLLASHSLGTGLRAALSMTSGQALELLSNAGLRGRGGAGFSTAEKWRMAANTPARERYIICNADEGEPGTFKDRVLLTERAELLFEGMAIAAHVVGARQGILYLRAEYRYLHAYLEHIIERMQRAGALGPDFDIRIQLGAGAYICGEESALISSCEGRRGEPKNRPPFPVESGYLGMPTVVNNVETLCNIAPIFAKGSAWFTDLGTSQSTGSKLLSVSGDCQRPGVYEVPMGTKLSEVLALAGAEQVVAVQVGGASGVMVGPADFERRLCFEDMPSAGAIVIFSSQRDILQIVDYYMHFFVEESCGYCTPCRVGNVFLREGLQRFINGQAQTNDVEYLKELSNTVVNTSRCGFGHTSPRPILTSLAAFPELYQQGIKEMDDGLQAGFDIQRALQKAESIAGRKSTLYPGDGTAEEVVVWKR